jgi:hypothetical protein
MVTETKPRSGAARHDSPVPIPIPADLPPGTRASLVEPDEIITITDERPKLERPIIYRSITHPGLVIFGRFIYRDHPYEPGKKVRYRLPELRFLDGYLRVEYVDDNERVLRSRYARSFFVEPTSPDGQPWADNDPNAPPKMEWRDDAGRVRFVTRNPQAFMAFERRMRS